jgi:hypothetical protein
LEQLIGKPLHEVSDEELEEIVMKGRMAREREATAAGKERVKKGGKKKAAVAEVIEFDLDDFE